MDERAQTLLENRKFRALERIAHAVEFLAKHADPGFTTLAEFRPGGKGPKPTTPPDKAPDPGSNPA